MRFAFLDGENKVLSAHNDLTIDELPTGAVLLTEEEWEIRFYLHREGNSWIYTAPEIEQEGIEND